MTEKIHYSDSSNYNFVLLVTSAFVSNSCNKFCGCHCTDLLWLFNDPSIVTWSVWLTVTTDRYSENRFINFELSNSVF